MLEINNLIDFTNKLLKIKWIDKIIIVISPVDHNVLFVIQLLILKCIIFEILSRFVLISEMVIVRMHNLREL